MEIDTCIEYKNTRFSLGANIVIPDARQEKKTDIFHEHSISPALNTLSRPALSPRLLGKNFMSPSRGRKFASAGITRKRLSEQSFQDKTSKPFYISPNLSKGNLVLTPSA